MASLWNALRSEVMGTVDEFRQKGAIGALRDAALDTKDMATDAGSWLWGNVKSLAGEDGQDAAVLIFEGVPARGATAPLQFSDGRVMEATVMEVDGVSDPPRAQVKVEGIEEPLLVLVRPMNEVVNAESDPGLLDSIKQEWDQTVQDFRQKGAVGALKDATFDAVDLVGSTAGKAVDLIGNTADKAIDGARSLIDLDAPTQQPSGEQGQVQASTQQPRGTVMQFVDTVKSEIKETVQDFREKGAVATFKDAALDAVDLVGNTATTAVNGAKTVAAPILEDFWAPKPEQTGGATPEASLASQGSVAASSSAPAEQPSAAAATAATVPVAAAVSTAAAAATATSPSPKAASSSGYTAASPPKAPEEGDDGKQAKKSLVSMRRGMFEQKKEETKEEPKKEEAQEEEVID